ncbi:MAG: type I glutamate--ammonia ligase [Candidatus Bathyarchaeia archaeon]
MDSAKEEDKGRILEICKKEDVGLIVLQFVDILGVAKSVTIPAEHLEEALDNGLGFDGSSIEGFVRIFESDMVAMPDPSTFRIIPWRPAEKKEARIICDIYRPGGRPFEGDPRFILKRVLGEAKEMGLVYNTGPELEFFLLKTEDGIKVRHVPHDVGGYFDLSPLDQASDVRRDAMFHLQDMGLDVEMSHHEVAPGQHEIDFKFADALTTADNVITYKNVIKAIATIHGLYATFMPKPFYGINGSGMHTHQSLYDIKSGKNVFFDPNDEYNMSRLAYHFIGGQLKYARAMSAVLAPTVNSYKRLVPGYEAPVYICWGRRNRSALIRVPEYFPGSEQAIRAELRCPDPSCNPYLAFAVMLKAGLEGIKRKIEPPEPVEEDVYEFDDRKLAEFYIETLPASLKEAIDELKNSKLMVGTLGDFSSNKYIEAKMQEWDEYRLRISEWELERYLKL